MRDRAGALGLSLEWYTTRERGREEILPWDHLDSGLDKDWLWDDWQDALAGDEQDDCRWTPCFDCGVCPSMGTDIRSGPAVGGCYRSVRSVRAAIAEPDGGAVTAVSASTRPWP